jgi:fatty acid CoA ligase FadD36
VPDLFPGLLHDRDENDAITVGHTSTSREALLGRSSAIAGGLAGAKVAVVHATPSLETIEAVVGALLAQVPLAVVPADVGNSERDHILRTSGADAVVGPWPWADGSFDLQSGVGEARPVRDPVERPQSSRPQLPDSRPALIMYTSGTTGPPKGAMISRSALAADLDALYEAWDWTAEDHLVHGLPLSHVHGLVLGVLGALRVGCRITHTVKPTPEAYAAVAGTLYFGVPTVWSRVAQSPGVARELRRARLLVSGSAPLPARTFARLQGITGLAPIERYGTTETLITLSGRTDRTRLPGTVGWPLKGVRARIAPQEQGPEFNGSKLEGDGLGELEVRGPTLFEGYVGDRASTKAGFTSDQWWRTGDAATVDADGRYRILGRLSTDLIKTGGYRVGAGEIEDELLAHPDVSEAAVVGLFDEDLGQRIIAYVVADGIAPADLVNWIAERLSVHKRPREVRMVDELPRNAMGKIQKTALIDNP